MQFYAELTVQGVWFLYAAIGDHRTQLAGPEGDLEMLLQKAAASGSPVRVMLSPGEMKSPFQR